MKYVVLLPFIFSFSLSFSNSAFAYKITDLEAVSKLRVIKSQFETINELPNSYSGNTDEECMAVDHERVKYLLLITDYLQNIDDRIHSDPQSYTQQVRGLIFKMGRVVRDLSGPLRHYTKFLLPKPPFTWETIENFGAIYNDESPIVFPRAPHFDFSRLGKVSDENGLGSLIPKTASAGFSFRNVFFYLRDVSSSLIPDFIKTDLPELHKLFNQIRTLLEEQVQYDHFSYNLIPRQLVGVARLPLVSTLTTQLKDYVSVFQILNFTSGTATNLISTDSKDVHLVMGLVRRLGESCTGKNLSPYFKSFNKKFKDLCQVAIHLRDTISHPSQKSNRLFQVKIVDDFNRFSEQFVNRFLPDLHDALIVALGNSSEELALLPTSRTSNITQQMLHNYVEFVRTLAHGDIQNHVDSKSSIQPEEEKDTIDDSKEPEVIVAIRKFLSEHSISVNQKDLDFVLEIYNRSLAGELSKDEYRQTQKVFDQILGTVKAKIKEKSAKPESIKEISLLRQEYNKPCLASVDRGVTKRKEIKNRKTLENREGSDTNQLLSHYFNQLTVDNNTPERPTVLTDQAKNHLLALKKASLLLESYSNEQIAYNYEHNPKLRFAIENFFIGFVDYISFLFEHVQPRASTSLSLEELKQTLFSKDSYLYRNLINLKKTRNLMVHYNWILDSSANLPIYPGSELLILHHEDDRFRSVPAVFMRAPITDRSYQTRAGAILNVVKDLISNSDQIVAELNFESQSRQAPVVQINPNTSGAEPLPELPTESNHHAADSTVAKKVRAGCSRFWASLRTATSWLVENATAIVWED